MSKTAEKLIRILAIESSCDDTSVAIVEAKSSDLFPTLVSWSVQNQDLIHSQYGGIVPELASRNHLLNLLPCFRKALDEAQLQFSDIDAFAATGKPGLIGSLLIGHSAAKTLSMLFDKAFISCDHLESHLASVFIDSRPKLPFLCLLVSGGHTSLYLIRDLDDFQLVGLALDDAAGEAFDKAAKMLGLSFPGGQQIDDSAQLVQSSRYQFPDVQTPGFDFSFSGIKSEMRRLVDRSAGKIDVAEAAFAFQEAVIGHLSDKILKALKEHQIKHLAIVGGVARNSKLRQTLRRWKEESVIENFYAPHLSFCTDNAVMVAFRAYRHYLKGEFSDLEADVGSTSRPVIKRRVRG